MKTIRKGVFETNSSSTHALCIPKEVKNEKYDLSDSLDHNYGFGREECRLVNDWDEKLAYAYIILKDYEEWEDGNRTPITKDDIKNFKDRVEKIYNHIYEIVEFKPYENEPRPKDIFEKVDKDKSYYCFVDHTEDFSENGFLERILIDDEFLMKFLFNRDSYITVGGDEYRGYNIKSIGFEDDYDSEETYYINEKGERPPKEWLDDNGYVKDEYWKQYREEYNIEAGGFWDKLREYEKDNDVYLKGN